MCGSGEAGSLPTLCAYITYHSLEHKFVACGVHSSTSGLKQALLQVAEASVSVVLLAGGVGKRMGVRLCLLNLCELLEPV